MVRAIGSSAARSKVGVGNQAEKTGVMWGQRVVPRSEVELKVAVTDTMLLDAGCILLTEASLSRTSYATLFRGHIGMSFMTEAEWSAWFTSCQAFIARYATLAEEAGVDLLVVGVELGGRSPREAEWHSTIADVRVLFSGPIT